MTLEVQDLVPAALRRRWASEGICPDLDLYALFRAHRFADPGRPAVIDAAGTLTYAELDLLARAAAMGLRRLGVCEGDVVGVQLPNGRDAVIAELAVAALGAVALPFPVGRGMAEAVSLLGRTGARVAVVATEHRGHRHAAELLAGAERLPALRAVVAAGPRDCPPGGTPWSRIIGTDATGFVPARPDPDGPARILVSSGSEAAPKMIAYSHNALAGGRGNFLGSLLGDGGGPPRCLLLVPLGSAFGSNGTPVTLARHGGCLVLPGRFSPVTALTALAEHRPTHVLAVPAMIRMMLDRPDTGPVPPMTALLVGGSELDARTADEARARFGCPVVNVYGSADGVNCHSGLAPVRAADDSGSGVVVGRPDPRVAEIRVAPVPGERRGGEILARGPMTPMCYVGAPELNQRYRTAEGWVRTGDLGMIDDSGLLHLVGRLKQIVIRGGLNISPAEVERALASHPRVRDTVCFGVPDPVLGERLAVCVVPRPGQVVDLDDLCAHLAQQGLEKAKHPERLLLVDELPLTPAGKPDRDALRERLPAEAPA
ncbi:long-chain fatty acid--CoA ligase [Actinomadura sp. KC216]|uniref:class I adenylate-forming enzyme family protein n=1 Tax=Actinomadura sp. KC216 TaxID=2530370 RepID=UPI0010494797|nr:class I adenylate-forming enzyme family protein [Actinomadura sp. KC216]TDB91932.1 long-chain fatty acid--CoA ligase [Actinomadura sp. KC216]